MTGYMLRFLTIYTCFVHGVDGSVCILLHTDIQLCQHHFLEDAFFCMWEVLMSACCFYWLMNKELLLAHGSKEQN